MGKLLVENLSSEHLDLSKHSDAYTKELGKLIDSKAKWEYRGQEEKEDSPQKGLDVKQSTLSDFLD